MKRKGWLLALCVAALLSTGFAFTYHEFVIDVVDGCFVCEGYTLALAEADRPIAVGADDMTVTVHVQTPDGEVALVLGQGTFALSESAVPYVRTLEDDAAAPEATAAPLCEICGQSTAIGRHFQLECGHYGCLVTADHPTLCTACDKYTCNSETHTLCEHCGVAWCVHVDLKCAYTRNPAPEAYATKTTSGTSYVDIQPGYVEGNPQNTKSSGWTPGEDYLKARSTAAPDSGGE